MGYFIHGSGGESGRPRAGNRGASDRVHLVIDAAVSDWIAALFERAAGAGGVNQAGKRYPSAPYEKRAIRRAFRPGLMDSSGQFC